MPPSSIGPYLLEQRLGEGASGETFLATGMGQRFALKRLHYRLSLDPLIAQRIRAQSISPPQAAHPDVARLAGILCHPHEFWLVWQYLPGEPLAQWVRFARERSLHVIIPRWCRLLDAFAALHKRGLVHGNVKPANIVVGPSGVFHVHDFVTGRVLGLNANPPPAYTAPEQRLSGEASTRSDIYSLGALLAHVASGDVPGQRTRLPEGLRAICARAMSENPEERYRTAGDMRTDLWNWMEAGTANGLAMPRAAANHVLAATAVAVPVPQTMTVAKPPVASASSSGYRAAAARVMNRILHAKREP